MIVTGGTTIAHAHGAIIQSNQGINPMNTRYHYVSFWADRHHKVRIIRANLYDGELGGAMDFHLARYCQHLEGKRFPGSRIIYEPGVDHDPTSLSVVEADTQEYLNWCVEADEDLCVL